MFHILFSILDLSIVYTDIILLPLEFLQVVLTVLAVGVTSTLEKPQRPVYTHEGQQPGRSPTLGAEQASHTLQGKEGETQGKKHLQIKQYIKDMILKYPHN
jgi:hypothetical protein